MEYVEQVTAEKDTFDVVSAEQTAHERRVQALERKMARLERELVDTEIALKHERLIKASVSNRCCSLHDILPQICSCGLLH